VYGYTVGNFCNLFFLVFVRARGGLQRRLAHDCRERDSRGSRARAGAVVPARAAHAAAGARPGSYLPGPATIVVRGARGPEESAAAPRARAVSTSFASADALGRAAGGGTTSTSGTVDVHGEQDGVDGLERAALAFCAPATRRGAFRRGPCLSCGTYRNLSMLYVFEKLGLNDYTRTSGERACVRNPTPALSKPGAGAASVGSRARFEPSSERSGSGAGSEHTMLV
jgi:hypothetical protein